MRRFLLAAAMCVTAMSCSRAADLSDLPILRGAVGGFSSSRVNWQGFYAGGQGGLGTTDMDFTGATQSIAQKLLFDTAIDNSGGVSSWPLGSKASVHGSGWGAFAGYNSQWDDVVLGVELNYMHGKFGGSQIDSMSRIFSDSSGAIDTVTYQTIAAVNVHDMASFRARAGYAWGVFLPYLFGGFAFGQADIVRQANIFGVQVDPTTLAQFPFFLSANDNQNSRLIHGWTAGAGLDMMIYSCLFLRAEWEFVQYSTVIDTSANTFRLGLGYKF
jgi:outer membrane immunogenic protein